MKKKITKILCAVLALCCSFGVAASDVLTTLAVKPSQVNYDIQVYDETEIGVYICNKTKVKNVGDEVYLTYTVDEVGKRNTAMQHGVIATDTYSFSWPYEQGGVLRYDDRMQLLDEGYTYFFKFVYTGNGKFDVTAGRAKDSISEYIGFAGSYGDATDDYAYFGVWFSKGGRREK